MMYDNLLKIFFLLFVALLVLPLVVSAVSFEDSIFENNISGYRVYVPGEIVVDEVQINSDGSIVFVGLTVPDGEIVRFINNASQNSIISFVNTTIPSYTVRSDNTFTNIETAEQYNITLEPIQDFYFTTVEPGANPLPGGGGGGTTPTNTTNETENQTATDTITVPGFTLQELLFDILKKPYKYPAVIIGIILLSGLLLINYLTRKREARRR